MADVLQESTPRAHLVLARYTVQTGVPPAAVSGIRARLGHGRLTVNWRPVCGASSYQLMVAGSHSTRITTKVTRASVHAGTAKQLPFSITAIGYSGVAGPSRKATARR